MINGIINSILWGTSGGGVSPLAPAIVTPPVITGTPTIEETISVSDGTWTNSPSSYLYRWYRDGVLISGATANTYTLTAEDVFLPITAGVRAVNASGTSLQANSDPTSDVAALYIEIPSAPFTTGYNRAMTGLPVTGQIGQSALGSPGEGIDVILTSDFTDGIQFNGIVGAAGQPYRFTNNSVITVGGAAVRGFVEVNINDYIEVYGKDKDNPIIAQGSGGGDSGIQFGSESGGASYKWHNIVAPESDFAGVLANSSSGSNTYRKLEFYHFRNIGKPTEGEGIYIGNTSSPYSVIDVARLKHIYVANKGRDGDQTGRVTDHIAANLTIYNVGLLGDDQQDHLLQRIDINGITSNSIFDGAPRLWNIFTHDYTFDNCYFRFTETAGFIGRTDNLSYYPNARFNGGPLLIKNCIIIDESGATTGGIVDVQERIADIEFRDCIFVTLRPNLYNDERVVGYTNSLIGTLTTNGNTVVSSFEAPTYTNDDASEYATHGLVTSNYYYNRGMGNRTPNWNEFVSAESPNAQTVPYDTAFGDLVLPSKVEVLLDDGTETLADVTWLEGDYDPEVADDYTIYGTLTVPFGYLNTANVQATVSITVQEEPGLSVTARGTFGNNTTATSIGISPASNCTAGAVILIFICYDNSNTGGTDPYTSITDSLGNTWTPLVDQLFNPSSSVNTGIVGRWFSTSQNAGAITTGTTITINFSPTTVNKVGAIWEIVGGASLDTSVKETSTSGSPTITLTGNAANKVIFGGIGRERNDTLTADADTTDGTWSTAQVLGVGGASNSGMKMITQYKVLTGAADQTYNCVTDGSASDNVEFILRFLGS